MSNNNTDLIEKKKDSPPTKGAYSHILTGVLKTYVTEQLEKPPEDQNSIQEELALMRSAASMAIEMYNAAVKSQNAKAIYAAGLAMKAELLGVVNTAQAASKIQSVTSDKMTRAAVESIISGIIDIIFGVLRNERNGLRLAAQIETEIAARVNMQIDRGTVVLPSDEVVRAMDSSIPGIVCSSEEEVIDLEYEQDN